MLRAIRIIAPMMMVFSLAAQAQDFGVMQSAETIKPGNFKFAVYPMFVQSEGRGDDDTGFVARAGYGFGNGIDGEFKYSSFDNGSNIGLDLEFALATGTGADVSLSVGGHLGSADNGCCDSTNLDLTLTASGEIAEAFELVGSIDVTFVSLDDAPRFADDSFTPVHLVAGFEYKLSQVVDLIGEFGIEINDEGADYGAIGIAIYLQ